MKALRWTLFLEKGNLKRRFMKYSTKFLLTTFLTLFVCQSAFAETLCFKVGDKASYTIIQEINAEQEMFSKEFGHSKGSIDIDVEILSVNEETLNYPYEVQVTLKHISAVDVAKDRFSVTTTQYDSESLTKEDNKHLVEYFEKLIGHPLTFTVEQDFQVKETSNYLTPLHEDFYFKSPCSMEMLGASPWTYQFFLTQLFHLSGEELQIATVHPKSCHQLLNWEDDEPSDDLKILNQECDYIIDSNNTDTIDARVIGSARVESFEDAMRGEVNLTGNVTWNATNPMIQQRDMTIYLEAYTKGFFASHAKLSIHQTWQSK